MTANANPPQLLDLICEREAAASATAEQLREQIAALTDQLTAAETELTELAITRKTLLRLTGPIDALSPADTTVASPAYQQILAVLTAAGTGLRAKDVCVALGTGATSNDTERLRAKLKRLVARQVLTEPEPGLFTLAETAPEPTTSSPTSDPNP